METNPPPSTAAGSGKKLNIVMFPWLAFGHMIPFLQLSELIAQKGHRISFVSTPRNIDRLPKIPPTLSPLLSFVKLPLPHVENLPQNAEATIDLPYEKVKYLKIAYDRLQTPITHFLKSSNPDWVFFDFAPYWLPTIAADLNIKTAYFNILNAAVLGFLGPVPVLKGEDDYRTKPEDFLVPPKWVPFESTVAFRLFEILRIFRDSVAGGNENVPDTYRIGSTIEGCDVIAVKSCSEFEPEWFQLLDELHRKPVLPVGLLPAKADDGDDRGCRGAGWSEIENWLDKQGKGSVVYIAFGSEAELSQDELTEVALGLELSKLPFFWVLRKHGGNELPDGFLERVKGRGLVWTSWAPQPRILSHDAVGGFFTHGGWGSLVDGIQFGRALIVLPFLSDQGINARILEEKKLGYSIPRDERDGSFDRDSVAESLRLVMVEDEGEIYRNEVKQMSALFGDRDRQDRYVDNLLVFLQSHMRQREELES
ncbi:hypothetical protein Vadar_018240 [Vaccinium darrowii]|uniref:Uncharacterized protein n=1 Tax=Vaccinium darrowii TaxID=229202 RepID=A0ACB7YGI5_9ERIC|nr:hypothetical protein Vadar_018240 [Vaccinium darrowii]